MVILASVHHRGSARYTKFCACSLRSCHALLDFIRRLSFNSLLTNIQYRLSLSNTNEIILATKKEHGNVRFQKVFLQTWKLFQMPVKASLDCA